MYIQNKYIQIHKNQSVAMHLMSVNIWLSCKTTNSILHVIICTRYYETTR